MYEYDVRQYRSPQRYIDPESGFFTDEWVYEHYFTVTLPDGRKIEIEPGFRFDKASVPRLAWWYLPRDDKHVLIASLIHDKLFVDKTIEGEPITLAEADRHFYGIIKQAGMRRTKAWLVYALLRAGSWTAWYG